MDVMGKTAGLIRIIVHTVKPQYKKRLKTWLSVGVLSFLLSGFLVGGCTGATAWDSTEGISR